MSSNKKSIYDHFMHEMDKEILQEIINSAYQINAQKLPANLFDSPVVSEVSEEENEIARLINDIESKG